MSIAPIIYSVEVKAPPARAFDLFCNHIEQWWSGTGNCGGGIGAQPLVKVVLEPHVGGRWYEIDADGNETDWGKVLAWEPPGRLLLAWQIGTQWRYDPDLVTELELSFAALPAGGTRVTLEHRNLERFGADAEKHAGQLNGGWPTKIARFTVFADEQG